MQTMNQRMEYACAPIRLASKIASNPPSFAARAIAWMSPIDWAHNFPCTPFRKCSTLRSMVSCRVSICIYNILNTSIPISLQDHGASDERRKRRVAATTSSQWLCHAGLFPKFCRVQPVTPPYYPSADRFTETRTAFGSLQSLHQVRRKDHIVEGHVEAGATTPPIWHEGWELPAGVSAALKQYWRWISVF